VNITWDIESNSLLSEQVIDYCSSPYKLKNEFKLHCIVVEEHETGKIIAFYDGHTYVLDGKKYEETIEGKTYTLENYIPVIYEHRQLKEFPEYIKKTKLEKVVGHNEINYDLLVAKLWYGMDYTVEQDTWGEQEVEFVDTMILSKTLNPDRFGGHSLESLSEKTGTKKIEFRKHLKDDMRFKHFAADMLYYNIYDSKSNTQVFYYLENEKKDWEWGEAIRLEKSVADIITRQEHRGFKFNKELAKSNIEELDKLMEERRARVEPMLPPRPATKKFLDEHTPPVRQFKKNGEIAADLVKWLDKVGGKIVGERQAEVFGKTYELPLPKQPLVTTMRATIDDTTHIKNWLVGLGWNPSEYKERDLSTDQKKQKLTEEKYIAVVDKYVEQTLESNFCQDRLDHLGTNRNNLRNRLLKTNKGRSIKVLTNPSLTKGQDKEMCPDLERIAEQFPHAKDVVEYLTFKHRRNSILGGGLEWEDEEEAEKGYLASVREDGRIPTPAGTCDASTSRFKHRVCANIPRVTSLYGEKMRGLFEVADGFYQMGYDFDSLEAREEAHYCWRWENTPKEYCNSLLLEKPNDVHSVMARKITEIIGREFTRPPAKNVKYGCTYGAQEAKVAKTIGTDLATGTMVFNAFWEAAAPLKTLRDKLKLYWETTGQKKFILGLDGRKVPTRSPHSILNSLFQSAGVLCAKRAMVLHDRKLKAENLWVDFFKDDWKNRSFCQQLIAYHDEAQCEISSTLVQFKIFKTKEEAQKFKDGELKTWSDIKESPKGGYFVAYTRAGELAVESVREAGEYYKLNVPLTAGYILGKNWAMCH
jgi:DNA polymerase I-like protein with 3'-5' exonuclease and polymerase domains